MHRAAAVPTEIEAVAREPSGDPRSGGTVQLRRMPGTGATLVPCAWAALRRDDPDGRAVGREGAAPVSTRALWAGSTGLAPLSSTPPLRVPTTSRARRHC
ncbi:hypothetical protein [Kitasatospora sp. NPDC057198]|uniref:hypothetical protein n=1 Tax=Kitasatospora sp. NPDC057198 TaxID=3346046 RepID=UPI003625A97C